MGGLQSKKSDFERHVQVLSLIHQLMTKFTGRSVSKNHDMNTKYDQETFEILKLILKQDSNCIDVGAHIGSILDKIIEFSPGGRHYAFEALPHFANILKQKFPNVQIHECAVSDKRGPSEFIHIENDPSYSGLRQRIYDRDDPVINTLTVEMTTLDDSVPVDIPIDFIKMDIEGGEYHALKGAYNIIQRWHPYIIFEAGEKSTGQYGVSPKDLFELITLEFGYDLSTMRRWLDKQPAFTMEEFQHNWDNGPDYYFIATPTLP